MKLVRENINEKFTDKSDPVYDMSIGGINIRSIRDELQEEYTKNFIKTFETILLNKNITGTFNQILVVRDNQVKNGDGWGKYTIHIDRISVSDDENSGGLTVFDDTEKTAYIIPYDAQKIFFEE